MGRYRMSVFTDSSASFVGNIYRLEEATQAQVQGYEIALPALSEEYTILELRPIGSYRNGTITAYSDRCLIDA